MVSRIINNYIDDVISKLPVRERKRAERELRAAIYEMLDAYMEGERPVGRYARAVLKELGTPQQVAEDYIEERMGGRRRHLPDIKNAAPYMVRILFALSVALVIVGMVLLVTGLSNNMFPLLFGGIIALGVMIGELFRPMPDQDLPRASVRQRPRR